MHRDGADGDDGSGRLAHPRSFALVPSLGVTPGPSLGSWSEWCMTMARAVKPCSSKKFFAARWPGSATTSIPMQPRRRGNARPARRRSPRRRRRSRAVGSTNRSVTTPRWLPSRSCSTTDGAEADRRHRRCSRRSPARRRARQELRDVLDEGFPGDLARRPQRPTAVLRELGPSSRARSAMRATSSGVAGRAVSMASVSPAPPPRRVRRTESAARSSRGSSPPTVRDLVRTDRVELRRAEPLEPVDDLRRRERVVVGDREVGSGGGRRRGAPMPPASAPWLARARASDRARTAVVAAERAEHRRARPRPSP